MPAACLEDIEAAHKAIDLGDVPPRLSQANERLWEAAEQWDTNRYVLAGGAGLAFDAARVGTQRMVDEAAGRGLGTPILCLHIACISPANCRPRRSPVREAEP
ncbi:hypothetical protein GCM10010377_39650 [Streptomyces viridiviolaceus]|nr:hypothetical protein GCM10010377_39650 [Streptomyces viridiviolaceus]